MKFPPTVLAWMTLVGGLSTLPASGGEPPHDPAGTPATSLQEWQRIRGALLGPSSETLRLVALRRLGQESDYRRLGEPLLQQVAAHDPSPMVRQGAGILLTSLYTPAQPRPGEPVGAPLNLHHRRSRYTAPLAYRRAWEELWEARRPPIAFPYLGEPSLNFFPEDSPGDASAPLSNYRMQTVDTATDE